MRNIISLMFLFVWLSSCDNGKPNKRILSESSGNLNNISVVVDNDLWQGAVGEAIRDVLGAPIYGLNQDEPMFNLSQIPTQVFSDFVTKNRTILKIEKGTNDPDVKVGDNVYAKPQRVILVTGMTDADIISQLHENASMIVAAFRAKELEEKQRRIKLSLHKSDQLIEKLGIALDFPSVYRIAKEENNVFWIRKDITTGTTNLLVYEIPFNTISRNDSLVNQIVRVRDSVNRAFIPGPTEDAYMTTEDAYAPFITEIKIRDRSAIETKGIWDMENAFMSGPFVNYMIEDKDNARFVVIEGFAFAPSVSKRDYMFELEAIIKSIQFK